MSEWKEIKLGDLGTVVTGKTPSKNNPEDWGNEILFITPSDYGNYRKWADNSIRKLSADGAERLSNKVLPVGSILVTCIGSDMGKVVMNRKDAITNQQINSIIPNTDVVIFDFAYYLLVDLYETLRIYGGDGTAVPIVNKGDFEKIDALIPEKDEQNAIAEVLSSLDDKIDLLHRQNQTLEQMAETLYDAWFEESDFTNRVSDLIDLQNGYAFKSKSFQDFGEDRVLKIKNISGGIVDIETTDFVSHETVENLDEKFSISTGDILFAMTGAKIGKMGIIPKTDYKLWLNQRVGLFKEKYYGSRFLAYLHLKSDYGKDYIENTATGSAQPNISGTGIENCEFPEISEEEIIDYSNQLAPLYKKVIFNLGQIQKLEALRNTLLPKLMSGEISIDTDE